MASKSKAPSIVRKTAVRRGDRASRDIQPAGKKLEKQGNAESGENSAKIKSRIKQFEKPDEIVKQKQNNNYELKGDHKIGSHHTLKEKTQEELHKLKLNQKDITQFVKVKDSGNIVTETKKQAKGHLIQDSHDKNIKVHSLSTSNSTNEDKVLKQYSRVYEYDDRCQNMPQLFNPKFQDTTSDTSTHDVRNQPLQDQNINIESIVHSSELKKLNDRISELEGKNSKITSSTNRKPPIERDIKGLISVFNNNESLSDHPQQPLMHLGKNNTSENNNNITLIVSKTAPKFQPESKWVENADSSPQADTKCDFRSKLNVNAPLTLPKSPLLKRSNLIGAPKQEIDTSNDEGKLQAGSKWVDKSQQEDKKWDFKSKFGVNSPPTLPKSPLPKRTNFIGAEQKEADTSIEERKQKNTPLVLIHKSHSEDKHNSGVSKSTSAKVKPTVPLIKPDINELKARSLTRDIEMTPTSLTKPVLKAKPKNIVGTTDYGLHPVVCLPLVGLTMDNGSRTSKDSGYGSTRSQSGPAIQDDNNAVYLPMHTQLSRCRSMEDFPEEAIVDDLGNDESQLLSRYISSGSSMTFEEYKANLHVDGNSTFEKMHESMRDRSQDGYYDFSTRESNDVDQEDDEIYDTVEYGERDPSGPSVTEMMRRASELEEGESDDDDWFDYSDFDNSDDSFEDIEEEEEEPTNRDKLYYIVRELMETEDTYVQKLELLNEARVRAEDMVKDCKNLFPYIEVIYKLHKDDFLPQLRDTVKYWEFKPKIGDIIKRFAPFLKMYTDYVKNFNQSLRHVEILMEKSTDFSTIVKTVCNQFEAKYSLSSLDIRAHMLEPVQRVPRYKLLLLDYLKHLPEECNATERADVQEALKLVSEAAEHFENTINQTSEFGFLMDLEKQIESPNPIVSTGRRLVKQGAVDKYCVRTDKLDSRYLFLFNDALVICKEKTKLIPGAAKYQTRQFLHTEGMKIYDGTNLDAPNTFLIKTKQKTLELVAESEEEKNKWQQALWKVVSEGLREKLQIKANQSVETSMCNSSEVHDNKLGKVAPVWVKNKDVTMCMMCGTDFATFVRRHHCRACGCVVCGKCSSREAKLEYENDKDSRVCDECFLILSSNLSPLQPRRTNKLRTRSKELCIKNGYLNVSSNEGRSWQKRYCEVHEGGLFYCYKASQDLKPALCLSLGRCKLLKLETINSNSKMLLLRVCVEDTKVLLKEDNPQEMIRWHDAFKSAMEDAICLKTHQHDPDHNFEIDENKVENATNNEIPFVVKVSEVGKENSQPIGDEMNSTTYDHHTVRVPQSDDITMTRQVLVEADEELYCDMSRKGSSDDEVEITEQTMSLDSKEDENKQHLNSVPSVDNVDDSEFSDYDSNEWDSDNDEDTEHNINLKTNFDIVVNESTA